MTTPSGTRTRSAVPHRRATTLITLGAPALITVATVLLALSWADRLPQRLASHWGPNGVDGFSSLAGLLAGLAGGAFGFAVLAWAIAYYAGHAAMTRRFAAGTAVWAAVLIDGLLVATLAVQLGLADGSQAGGIGGSTWIVLVSALALAVAAAALVPGDRALPTTAPIPAGAALLDLPDAAQAGWVHRVATLHPVLLVTLAVVLGGFVGGINGMWWLALVVAGTIGPLLVALTSWAVTVDHRGLTARTSVGYPTLNVPLDEVEFAEVTTVDPLREFGGWGIRTGRGGRVGVVVRKGPALQVHRTGGRVFVVTVDDAATGAALLNTLAARTRSS